MLDKPKFPDEIQPLLTDMNGARRALDCGLDRLYDLIEAGLLDSFLDGQKRKITIASIERYIAHGVEEAKKSERAGAALRRKRRSGATKNIPAQAGL